MLDLSMTDFKEIIGLVGLVGLLVFMLYSFTIGAWKTKHEGETRLYLMHGIPISLIISFLCYVEGLNTVAIITIGFGLYWMIAMWFGTDRFVKEQEKLIEERR